MCRGRSRVYQRWHSASQCRGMGEAWLRPSGWQETLGSQARNKSMKRVEAGGEPACCHCLWLTQGGSGGRARVAPAPLQAGAVGSSCAGNLAYLGTGAAARISLSSACSLPTHSPADVCDVMPASAGDARKRLGREGGFFQCLHPASGDSWEEGMAGSR